ncbi:MAG: hypothetical protein AB8F34_09730, partial [Akkermansiaceae bacterium]
MKFLFPFAVAISLLSASHAQKPVKVFILAGDEHVLEQALIKQAKKDKVATGTLVDVVANNPKYAFLKKPDGSWASRKDVLLYDAHSIHNNTEA